MATSVIPVTTSFVRNLRKQYMDMEGKPLEGAEQTTIDLLVILKALQQGAYDYAMDYAKREIGMDLEVEYSNFRAEIAENKAIGSNWKQVETACKVWGAKDKPQTVRMVDEKRPKQEMAYPAAMYQTREDFGSKLLTEYPERMPHKSLPRPDSVR